MGQYMAFCTSGKKSDFFGSRQSFVVAVKDGFVFWTR